MKKLLSIIFAILSNALNSFMGVVTPGDVNVHTAFAKVKLSALVSEMRGKLNGSVFSRNKGGAYLRTKVTPLNPQTSSQVAVRSQLAFYSQNWRSLTEAQRAAWNGAVSNFKGTDIFGDVKELTGLQLYTKLNINIATVSGTPITTPPVPVGADALTALSGAAAETGQTFTATFAPTPVPTDHDLVIEATEQVSAGISNANSLFRIIQVEAAAAISPANIAAAYIAKFGALVAGQKIFLRAKLINNTTGEVSQSLKASVVVGA